jgi:hypothetical protein
MKKLMILILTLALCGIWGSSFAGAPRKLVWDANTETDLAGYKVYWGQINKVGGEWPAFQDIILTLTNVIDVGNVTEFSISTLSPVEGNGYCFSVTAYDTSANESGFGEIACYTEVADPVVKDADPQLASPMNQEIIYE